MQKKKIKLYLMLPFGTFARSLVFYRVIVNCVIKQLYETRANDHQCHTWVETQ